MTENWDGITALFGAARLLDSAARSAFLDAACAHDPALRVEVERLLSDSEQQDDFLEPPWAGWFSPAFSLPALGDRLNDRYRIEAAVASGGQALVYRAIDAVLSRPVIVKVMRAGGRENALLKSRFEQEKAALSRIDHPGVVGILDVGELPDGCPFLVIQYVNGVSLREELRKGPLERRRAARLLRELGSALGAAHAAGIAHRDLKPENIMIQRFEDGTETLKLIDFGISKIDRAGQAGLTNVTVSGTVRYMAPEQFEGEHTLASDVYALSLVACEMLSGHPDSRAVPKSISARTRRLLDAALAFRPEDRPRDGRRWTDELADALTAFGARVGALRWIGTAAAAILIVAGAAAALSRWADPKPSNVPKVAAESLTGDWNVTGILTVCGFLCGSPVGTVYHHTARFAQDTPTTFHGTYGDYPVRGTQSGDSVSFGIDNFVTPTMTVRGDCTGTVTGKTMTVNCIDYLKPHSGTTFHLNGSRVDTVVKQ